MSFAFNPHRGLLVLDVGLTGPSGSVMVRLALDTGATDTVFSESALVAVGCDPAPAPTRVQDTTGSGVEVVPRLSLDKLTALGLERLQFPVLCHTLPPGATIDGVLDLDFLRGRMLTLDFQAGQITLS